MYSIYMHRFPNNKVYIGCTQMKPEIRFGQNGIGYMNASRIWSAIQEFGWDNIEHSVLMTTHDRSEAVLAELRYIKQYDACNPDKGYNAYCRGLGKPMKTLPAIVGQHISEAKRGTIAINRDGVYRYIKSDELARLQSEGWKVGGKPISDLQKAKISEANRGTVYIHRNGEYRKIKIVELAELESQGWCLGGRPVSAEQKAILSQKNTGKRYSEQTRQKLSQIRTGLRVVHLGTEMRRVKPEELPRYLEYGWELGVSEECKQANKLGHQGLIQSDTTKQKRSAAMKGVHSGKKQIHKDGMRKLVPVSELDSYLADGWSLGIGPRAKPTRR